MRKIHILLGVALILVGLTACEKEMATYSGAEGIYFNKRMMPGNLLSDSTNFTFVYVEQEQDTQAVVIPVQLVGKAADFDRPVNIKVAGGDAVAGTDFLLPENPVLPAGAYVLNYRIVLKRSEALLEKARTLVLAIESNEYFEPVVTFEVTDAQSGKKTSALQHKIEFSELFVAPPAAWNESISGQVFTPQKFFLLCRVMDVPRADFNDVAKISLTRFLYLVAEMQKYVMEQAMSANPDPEIFDEDGNMLFVEV